MEKLDRRPLKQDWTGDRYAYSLVVKWRCKEHGKTRYDKTVEAHVLHYHDGLWRAIGRDGVTVLSMHETAEAAREAALENFLKTIPPVENPYIIS